MRVVRNETIAAECRIQERSSRRIIAAYLYIKAEPRCRVNSLLHSDPASRREFPKPRNPRMYNRGCCIRSLFPSKRSARFRFVTAKRQAKITNPARAPPGNAFNFPFPFIPFPSFSSEIYSISPEFVRPRDHARATWCMRASRARGFRTRE